MPAQTWTVRIDPEGRVVVTTEDAAAMPRSLTRLVRPLVLPPVTYSGPAEPSPVDPEVPLALARILRRGR